MPAIYTQDGFGDDPVQDFVPVDDPSLPDISVGIVNGLGEDFVVHGRSRDGFVDISVRKIDLEIILRAIEEAIGQSVAIVVDQ